MKKSEIRALADVTYANLDDDRNEAAALYAQKVLATAPHDPESYLLMAEVAEESDRFDQALNWVNRGLTHFNNHEGLMLKKASIYLDGFEDIDSAFLILSKLRSSFLSKNLTTLKKDVGSAILLEIYLLLVDCFRLKYDLNQALECAKLAFDIESHDENAILALATAHFEVGEYDKALTIIEPVLAREDAPDFYWQKAQILCAQGKFADADQTFLLAYKKDKSRYHRPVRLDEHDFANTFMQALMGLPREILSLIKQASISLSDVIPVDVIKESNGSLAPQACISIERSKNVSGTPIIFLYQKNIENLASKKSEIKDLIASALLHDLGKLATNY